MKNLSSLVQGVLFLVTPFAFLYFTESGQDLTLTWILKVLGTKAVASLAVLIVAILAIMPVKKLAYGGLFGRKRIISLTEKKRLTRNYLLLCIPLLCGIEYAAFAQILDLQVSMKSLAVFVAVSVPAAILSLLGFMAKIRMIENSLADRPKLGTTKKRTE